MAYSAVCMGILTLSKWIPDSVEGRIRVDSWTPELESANPGKMTQKTDSTGPKSPKIGRGVARIPIFTWVGLLAQLQLKPFVPETS